jgi:hypothetical protein
MAGRLQESYIVIINFLSDYYKKESYSDVFSLFGDSIISNINTAVSLMKLHTDEIQVRANATPNLNRNELIDGLSDPNGIVDKVLVELIKIKADQKLQGDSLVYLNNFLYSVGHYVINWNFQVPFSKKTLEKANVLSKILKGTKVDSKEMFSVLLPEETK